MARARSTQDCFIALAESKRRRLLETLGARELTVNDLVALLGWPQPMISKHLGVLKQVGLVSERRVGRYRVYRVNASKLKPVQDWVQTFERSVDEQLDRLDDYLHEIEHTVKPPTADR